MKTAVNPDLESKTLCSSKNYTLLQEREIGYFDFKLYQKLFVVFISLSIILIFPESPRDLEKICNSYNSTRVCNAW